VPFCTFVKNKYQKTLTSSSNFYKADRIAFILKGSPAQVGRVLPMTACLSVWRLNYLFFSDIIIISKFESSKIVHFLILEDLLKFQEFSISSHGGKKT
jgi:hypothetical protein